MVNTYCSHLALCYLYGLYTQQSPVTCMVTQYGHYALCYFYGVHTAISAPVLLAWCTHQSPSPVLLVLYTVQSPSPVLFVLSTHSTVTEPCVTCIVYTQYSHWALFSSVTCANTRSFDALQGTFQASHTGVGSKCLA